ncbi:MAG: hypothetical protein ACM3H8_12575 [Sphingobacteriales bacterium]
MKKTITIFLLACTLNSYGQDTTKIEQYCEVVSIGRFLSTRVTIDVDYGEERSGWKDNRIKDEDGKLKKFNSAIDAINYLGKIGWKLVNAYPTSTDSNVRTHYLFKKEFLKSETQ